MLPSKGYFNSLDCPFYLSPTQCSRPYCHFKHPRRVPNVESTPKIDQSIKESHTISKPVLPLPSVEPVAQSPPVKHIPVSYIPTKPSAISVNTKKPKSILTKINCVKTGISSAEYDPLAVVDSSEKTYSRYSYEKQDNDSEDEFFRPLFNHTNKARTDVNNFDDGSKSAFDDESKSGYDDETDDYPEGAQFSNEEEEEEGMQDQIETLAPSDDIIIDVKPDIKELESNLLTSKENKCKKKRKYSEINSSKSNGEEKSKFSSNNNSSSPKKIKVEDKSNHTDDKISGKKVCKYKDKKKLSESSKVSKNYSESKKHSSANEKHSTDKKKSYTSSHHNASDPKSSSDNKSSSDKKSHDKKDSSSSSKKRLDSKKHRSKTNSGSTSNKSSNTDKHDSKEHSSSKSKHSSSDSKLSSSKRESSENKHHSSSSNKPHSSEKHKSSSLSKKQKNSESKLKENSTNKKDSSTNSKSSDRKHSDKSIKHAEKNSSSKKSSSYKSGSSKDGKSRSGSTKDSSSRDKVKNKNNLKRKHSISSSSDDNEKKETILISDSCSGDEAESVGSDNRRDNNSPVGINDILGLSDSDQDNNHMLSESENEEEYIPKPVSNCAASPVYKPTSKKDLDEIQKKIKIVPPTLSIDDYKPAQSVSKVRIAHVPNVSSLISAKTLISSGKTVSPNMQRIVTATHIVNPRQPNRNLASTSKPRPLITNNLDSNILISTRQPGLNNIFDELIKFTDYDEAYRRAIEEETEICNIATNLQSYRNRIALCILRIRKSKGAPEVIKKEKITSASIPDYTYGVTLYECFSKYLLKPEDYVLHGYPLELPGKSGCVYIDKNSYFRNKHNGPREGPFRKCSNCGQEYAIDEETEMPLTKNDCHHHWGKPIGIARLGKIYTCCKGEVGSEPCHTSLYHVTETKNDDCLEGFVRTRPYPADADPNKAGIYAMDCEMCFTTKGREIVRVSMLSIDNESVYDVLIKPKYPILDYCTRFSGITEEKLRNVTTTLPEVQKFILKMINDKTILVGHSLENDLKALKLIHYNVVDTSIIYPHKEGLPVKCALRTLTSRILGQAIQTGENGHDSLEDARASLMLVLHQVKEDAKSRKPRVVKQLKSLK